MAPQANSKKRNKLEQGFNSLYFDPPPAKKVIIDLSGVDVHPKSRSTAKAVQKLPNVQAIIDLSEDEPAALQPVVQPVVQHVVVGKTTARPIGTFPRFHDGDVYIELKYKSNLHTYQLHQGILCWNSSWFADAITQPWDDLDNNIAGRMMVTQGICARFELFMHPKSDIELVQRTSVTKIRDENLRITSQQAPKSQESFAETNAEPTYRPTLATRNSSYSPSTVTSEVISPGLIEDKIADVQASNLTEMETENLKSKTCTKTTLRAEVDTFQTIVATTEDVAAYIKTEVETAKTDVLDPENCHPNFNIKTKTENSETAVSTTKVIKTETKSDMDTQKNGVDAKMKIEENKPCAMLTEDAGVDQSPKLVVPDTMDLQACIKNEHKDTEANLLQEDILAQANIFEGNSKTINVKREEAPACVDTHIKTEVKRDARNDTETIFSSEYTAIPENKAATWKQEYSAEEQAGLVQVAKPRQEILDAYKSLFSIYYNRTPIINNTKIQIALEQMELLTRVAEVCRSTAVVIPHIKSVLFGFEDELPKAILADPPRWLMFSLKIKSPLIYRVAMVHIAGSYPIWPASGLTDDDVPVRIVQFIERAQNQTALLKSGVDKKLFCNSIAGLSEDQEIAVGDTTNTNAWFIVQLWRDWFSKAMSRASEEDGTLYRLLAQGGEAYLPLDSVMAELVAFRIEKGTVGDINILEISNNLRILKKQAQDIVAPLCVNNSRLSVEEAGIKYLTCTEIVNNDLPWILLPKEFEI